MAGVWRTIFSCVSFKSVEHTTRYVCEQLEVITASPEHLAFSLRKNVFL